MCAGQHFSTLRLTPPLVSERRAREWQASSLPWLVGQVGKGRIGSGFHEECAREAGLEIIRDVIPKPGSCQTSGRSQGSVRYGLEVWPEWSRALRYPPRTLIYLVSRNIQ